MAANSYATDLLEKIAVATNISQELASLPDGFHYRRFTYNDRYVTVEIQQGNVTHIGYSLFSKTQRDLLKSPICNFIERYSLELTLPLQREKSVSRKMEEDGIFFRNGSFDSFQQIEQDSTFSVNMETLNDKRYTVSWSRGEKEIFAINFPVEYELLAGCNMLESERRFIAGIQNMQSENQLNTAFAISDALRPTWQGKYYVLKGETYYLPQLNSDKYYIENKNDEEVSYQLLYDSDFIVESLANMFTTMEIPNHYTLELRVRKYGLKEDTIYVSLNQWTAFCIKEGCVPYFGVAKNGANVECEIVMYNRVMGYSHVVRTVIDSETVEDREGIIKARVVPYVPTTRIKYLFDELKL